MLKSGGVIQDCSSVYDRQCQDLELLPKSCQETNMALKLTPGVKVASVTKSQTVKENTSRILQLLVYQLYVCLCRSLSKHEAQRETGESLAQWQMEMCVTLRWCLTTSRIPTLYSGSLLCSSFRRLYRNSSHIVKHSLRFITWLFFFYILPVTVSHSTAQMN